MRPPRGPVAALALAGVVAVLALAGCADADPASPASTGQVAAGASGTASPAAGATTSAASAPPGTATAPLLPYAGTGPGAVQGAATQAKSLVYVPEQLSASVQVIDPATLSVIATYPVARSPEHVVPSHDLKTLWVNSDAGNTLTSIDPTTGKVTGSLPVDDPYNLYFTPDGSSALVMAEARRRIDVRDPQSMKLIRSTPVPCVGLNHADFTADLKTLLVSCEFSGQLVVLDADANAVQSVIDLNAVQTPGTTSPAQAMSMGGPKARLSKGASSMPQDVRLAPDGKSFLVADMLRNGVWVIDAATMKQTGFIQTGMGAHAVYPSRDAKSLYISNRDDASVTVIDAATLTPSAKWALPKGASPDMGGVTVDGSQLWLSGRYSSAVYVIDTKTGETIKTIPVKAGPHGLLVWPQPGRISLGHTGNMR
ncbi:MAG: hypothetical protein ABIW80_04175 [Lapillicoccus sp.]